MDKKELQKKLNDIKSQIKANSKDAHFADTLIEELLTTKARMGVEPIELNVGKKIENFSGETFEIVRTDRGIMYNEHGHYAIFVEQNHHSLYDKLREIIEYSKRWDEINDEEKELYELHFSAVAQCLNLPKIVFNDAEFTLEVAIMVKKYINNLYEKLMNEPLQDETVEEDRAFEDATIALNEMVNTAIIEEKQ